MQRTRSSNLCNICCQTALRCKSCGCSSVLLLLGQHQVHDVLHLVVQEGGIC
jgi:hypothetical protein